MLILENLIGIFAPHTCLACGVEDNVLLCASCRTQLPQVPSRCYRCKAVTEDFAVCIACRPYTPLRTVLVHTYYRGAARQLVHRMKYERARAGIDEIAALLATIVSADAETVLVHIPTATSRVRARGYDQARLLARMLGRHTQLPARSLLARMGQAHQVGANRAGRLRQLQSAFRSIDPDAIQGKHIMLVDDVLTTGATLETAARTLRAAGAKRVSAIVFAQA